VCTPFEWVGRSRSNGAFLIDIKDR
jgi:hypothetical protein